MGKKWMGVRTRSMEHGYTEVGDERIGISRLEMYCEKQTRQNRKDWAIRNYVLVEQPQEMRLADWQTVPSMVDVVWSSAGGKEKRTATAAKSQCIIIITSYCFPYYSVRSKSE